ncbi:MAG TPA: hypothetical protein VL463_28170 [Kofleriaceae bacterium]|jgi:hypothetical protein|nr:hypothetical protein [Kofleriaceae bacterium]
MRNLLLLFAIAACHPARSAYVSRGDPMSTPAPSASSSGGTSAAEASVETGEALAPATHSRPDESTPSSSQCMYNPASGRYAVCAHVTNDGLCAAFGAPCGPGEMGASSEVAPCMFDGGGGRYAHCTHVTSDGQCAAFGSWCGPDDLNGHGAEQACMFDPSDGHMKTCDHVTNDGKCAAYGGWCQP